MLVVSPCLSNLLPITAARLIASLTSLRGWCSWVTHVLQRVVTYDLVGWTVRRHSFRDMIVDSFRSVCPCAHVSSSSSASSLTLSQTDFEHALFLYFKPQSPCQLSKCIFGTDRALALLSRITKLAFAKSVQNAT
ncbi:hypothetical protein KCV07_g18, partial [Aureobasidium melanogenum]